MKKTLLSLVAISLIAIGSLTYATDNAVRNGWYQGDYSILDKICKDIETQAETGFFDGVSVYKGGKLVLNVKSGAVVYNNDMDTCGEGYHILTYKDLKTLVDNAGEKRSMFDEETRGEHFDISGKKFMFDEAYGLECAKQIFGARERCDSHGFCNISPTIVPPLFTGGRYSDDSVITAGYIYDEDTKKFGKGSVGVSSIDYQTLFETEEFTGTLEPDIVLGMDFKTIQAEDSVMCATYYPIATFLKHGKIVEQKPIPAGTTIELSGGFIPLGGITTMPVENTEFEIGCAEGYHEVNNKCITDKAGVFYKDGYIKITDGEDRTVYIKDKNQGADESLLDSIPSRFFDLKHYINKLMMNYYNGDITYEEADAMLLEWANKNIGTFSDIFEIEDYTQQVEEIYKSQNSTFGTYYFRGNNTGASWEELGVNGDDLEISQDAIDRGFNSIRDDYSHNSVGCSRPTPGCIRNEWVDGGQTPCNSDEGEYLPSGNDWIEAMELWSEINGYEGSLSDFLDEVLVPYAGQLFRHIPTQQEIYNTQKNPKRESLKNMLVYLFANPVMAEYQMPGGDYVEYGGERSLMSTPSLANPNDNYEYFLRIDLYGFELSHSDEFIREAAPVRCFIQKSEIEHTVVFETNGGSPIPDMEIDEGNKLNQSELTTTRDGFSFAGWYTDSSLTIPYSFDNEVEDNITLYAKRDKLGSRFSGGGGGGSKTSSDEKDVTNNPSVTDDSPRLAGQDSLESGAQGDSDDGSSLSRGDTASAERGSTQTYTQEFQQAYEFAKGKGITTMPTIQKANMDGKLTRIAMAKMLSQYAMNVLGQKPANIVTPKFNDVSDKQNSDYDDGVTLAYQLGIMGQNMPNNKFRPNDEVTRAEFATALSRMIYHTSDGEYKSTPKYYIHHMEKLVKEGIITKDDPNMKELRGYVMIMLMRSAK